MGRKGGSEKKKKKKNSYKEERIYYFESLCREWPGVENPKTHFINKLWAQVRLSPITSFPVRTQTIESASQM